MITIEWEDHNSIESDLLENRTSVYQPKVIAIALKAWKTLARALVSTFDRITRMSTTPDTTTSGGLANADHQASDKGKVASRNTWRLHEQKLKPVSTTNETMKFEGKCDDLSGYIYDCADPKQAADMYMSTTKEISEYVGHTYKYGGEMKKVMKL